MINTMRNCFKVQEILEFVMAHINHDGKNILIPQIAIQQYQGSEDSYSDSFLTIKGLT